MIEGGRYLPTRAPAKFYYVEAPLSVEHCNQNTADSSTRSSKGSTAICSIRALKRELDELLAKYWSISRMAILIRR